MAAGSRLMIAEAERPFPVRIRLAHPHGGLGPRLNRMHAWLDENCGADGWAITPSGTRGVINDAVAIYFLDAAIANASSRAGAPDARPTPPTSFSWWRAEDARTATQDKTS